jgi:8-oxo-dGTP pyrophosphatase MutT (NUDIX family)
MRRFRCWLEEFTDEGFWGNVGAGILPIARTTGRLLIAHRSGDVAEPYTWGVWGGKVDDEEVMDLEGEAKREFQEETGYSGSIKMYPAYVYRSQGGFEYHNFVGVIDDEFQPRYNWETQGHRWVTWDELQSLGSKHFGLDALLSNSGQQIQQIIQQCRQAQSGSDRQMRLF